MGKKIIIIITIIIAISISVLYYFQYTTSDLNYTAILSTDGNIHPGQRQDFLITVFRENDNKGRELETNANIALNIIFSLTNGSKKEAFIPLTNNTSGKYICSYSFPDNLDESEIEINLVNNGFNKKCYMSCKIPAKREKAIIVEPPKNQVYIGDKITFKLASIEKKTGFSLFKVPIRVKLISPSGYTTINRVITTDADGLANFETYINSASPEGLYDFIFQSDNFEQKISIFIKDPQKTKERLSFLDTPQIYSPNQDSNEKSGYIFNLNCEKNNILIAYGCPDSEIRQIEIWQNGNLHYLSDFPLEGGIVTLTLNKPLLAACPALFKVWQLKDNLVSSHEKIRFIPPNNPNKFGQFLIDVNSEFQNTEKDKLAASLARKGFIGTSSNLKNENLTKIFSQNIKSVITKQQNEITLDYYENLLKNIPNTNSPRFLLLEHELALSDYKKCNIFLDTSSFFEEYLKELNKKQPSLETLLQETICRIDRYQFLDLHSQKDEIPKLESLLIPISELYYYLNKFKSQKKIYAPSILSCINKMKDIIFVPAEFTFDFKEWGSNLNSIPMLNIEPYPRSFQSIQGLLQQSGKVMLLKGDSSTVINLDKPIISISSEECEKLINLRSNPILIEVN